MATNLVNLVTVAGRVPVAIKSTTNAATVTNASSESGDTKGAALIKLDKSKSSKDSSDTKGAVLAKVVKIGAAT